MILTSLSAAPFALDAPAAAALEQAFDDGCPRTHITETFRSYDAQVRIFLQRYTVRLTGNGPYGDVRWWQGRRYVRTSGLGMAAIPGTSTHGTGNAIDCNDPMRSWLRTNPGYGFHFNIPSEPWHAEFIAARYTKQEDDMATPIEIWSFPVKRAGQKVQAIQELADAKTIGLQNKAALDSLKVKIDAITKPAPVDLDALATKVAKLILPAIAKAVNDDIAKRMQA